MGIDGGVSFGRISANIVGVGAALRIAAKGSYAVAFGLGWLPSPTA